MKLWRMDGGELQPLTAAALDAERDLHQWLLRDLSVLDPGLLVIGSEVPTAHGGRIDLLAIDHEGTVSLIELKRDRTPREIVAQVLDYASWLAEVSTSEIHDIADSYWRSRGGRFAEAFTGRFGTPLPEALNVRHRMVIVAGSLDPASRRIVEYLSERHGVAINTAFFSVFSDGDRRFMVADCMMDQDEVVERSDRRVRMPWSGEFYVNVGEGSHRCWADMRRYGFIAAGHGRPYIDAILVSQRAIRSGRIRRAGATSATVW